jgi:membrane protein implicated in regulation of membrane protease activity
MLELLYHYFWIVIFTVFGGIAGSMVFMFAYPLFPILLAVVIGSVVQVAFNPPLWAKIVFALIAFGCQMGWARRSERISKEKGEEIVESGRHIGVGLFVGAVGGLIFGIFSYSPEWASGWVGYLVGGGATILAMILLVVRVREWRQRRVHEISKEESQNFQP